MSDHENLVWCNIQMSRFAVKYVLKLSDTFVAMATRVGLGYIFFRYYGIKGLW